LRTVVLAAGLPGLAVVALLCWMFWPNPKPVTPTKPAPVILVTNLTPAPKPVPPPAVTNPPVPVPGPPVWNASTLAGQAGTAGDADGPGPQARFRLPNSVAADAAGNLYVADTGNNIIRKISPTGVVSTFAGSAAAHGATDGLGDQARFWAPFGLAVDRAGNVYVADTANNLIRKITPIGFVTTLAGQAGQPGASDGNGLLAQFRNPWGVAVDARGNVYVADMSNNTIRKITPAGIVTTLAGQPGAGGQADGPGAQARFNAPYAVAVDHAGNVFVSDSGNQAIRKITPAGVVTTFAGLPGYAGHADGTGPDAQFWNPQGLALDDQGNLYVADTGNQTLRKITPAGVVTTLAGEPEATGVADGAGAAARFNGPGGAAVDAAGNLYVADTGNQTLRKLFFAPRPSGDPAGHP